MTTNTLTARQKYSTSVHLVILLLLIWADSEGWSSRRSEERENSTGDGDQSGNRKSFTHYPKVVWMLAKKLYTWIGKDLLDLYGILLMENVFIYSDFTFLLVPPPAHCDLTVWQLLFWKSLKLTLTYLLNIFFWSIGKTCGWVIWLNWRHSSPAAKLWCPMSRKG